MNYWFVIKPILWHTYILVPRKKNRVTRNSRKWDCTNNSTNAVFLTNTYRKVASSRLSRLVAHPRIFRGFTKGKFDANVLWHLAIKFQNLIVDRSKEVGFDSFLSSGFTTMAVINLPDRKLAKCTSVHCGNLLQN